MSDVLTAVQEGIESFLGAQEFFSNSEGSPAKPIEVFTERKGDIGNRISIAIGKIGVCCVVTTPVGENPYPNDMEARIKPTVVVTVIENVTVNRSAAGTGQPAAKIAQGVAHFLHQSEGLREAADGAWLIFKDLRLNPNLDPRLAYDVVFEFASEVTLSEPTR